MAVYKGRSLDSLTALSALTFDGHWGRLGLDVLADETYYIALDTPAEAADPGWIKLGVVPGNGTADNAAPIVPGNILVNGRTEGAFNEDPALSPTAVRQLWMALDTRSQRPHGVAPQRAFRQWRHRFG